MALILPAAPGQTWGQRQCFGSVCEPRSRDNECSLSDQSATAEGARDYDHPGNASLGKSGYDEAIAAIRPRDSCLTGTAPVVPPPPRDGPTEFGGFARGILANR